MSAVVQDVIATIERMSEPSVMSKIEAIKFYEEIISELEMRIDGLREALCADDK